ncbi:MAG TPA: hypothetical protein H9823_05710 [Candidatus Rubneribacter avistercoris]|nr:hypothetical protein [Candidatus Rubneribacter avistercoris]
MIKKRSVCALVGLAICMGAFTACSPSGQKVDAGADSGSTTLGEGVRAVEAPESFAIADSSTYDGTDPVTLIEEHCFSCHEMVPFRGADQSSPNPLTDWLLTYKAESPEAALIVSEEMALVCNNMTEAQVEALAEFYTPSE